MKTITEVSEITGIIQQRINDYEKAGLLKKPSVRNKYNYRLYSDEEIVRLWQIRFYKELGFTIPEIRKIFDDPSYQLQTSLEEQIEALEEKKNQIDRLLVQARALLKSGLEPTLAYDLVPGIKSLTYDEAAQMAFLPWSEEALDAFDEVEEDDEQGDAMWSVIEDVVQSLERGCAPQSPKIQTKLLKLKDDAKMPISAVRAITQNRNLQELLLEAFGEEGLKNLDEAIKIAAAAEAKETEQRTAASINKLLSSPLQDADPASLEMQAEIEQFLNASSFGVGFCGQNEIPTDTDIEGVNALIKHYENRKSAYYSMIARKCLVEIKKTQKHINSKGKASKEIDEQNAKQAEKMADDHFQQISKSLLPGLRIYLEGMLLRQKRERHHEEHY